MKKSHILTVILVLFLTFSLGVGRSTAQGTGPDSVLIATFVLPSLGKAANSTIKTRDVSFKRKRP